MVGLLTSVYCWRNSDRMLPCRYERHNPTDAERRAWIEEFEAAARRPLEVRMRYAFVKAYKPVLDDADYRSFNAIVTANNVKPHFLPGWLWPRLNLMLDPLPIDAILPDLLANLRAQPSLVLRAPTGAGKTTRVPPALLDAKLTDGRILVLEPRRLAARAAARRMAQERGQRVGEDVGYHVRFDRQVGPRTRIIVMTPGILLRMMQDDPFLEAAGAIVFDEFHERALDNDLALGMIRLLQTTVRPELRIVVMSATLATDAIAAYLGGCPIMTSEGRLHPVEITYEPRSLHQPWPVAAARAIERVAARTDGDILCFLPGMQEIRQTARELGSGNGLVLPLHGDLSPEEQDRALLPQPERRIVLATNVAETSVTVEGVAAVVDTGLARMSLFEPAVGMDRLELTPIAKDAADQRAGRAGRTRPGVCVRLWSAASHVQRAAQTLPEIRRVDLAGAALQLLCLGETELRTFPWLEPPRAEAIAQALQLLRRLGAMEGAAITKRGRYMARTPVHPRLARLLIEGQRFGQAPRIALAAVLLSERDPFLRGGQAGPRRRHAGSYSDVLDRVEALEAHEKDGTTAFAVGTLESNAARFLLRARDQLLRTLRQEVSVPPSTSLADADDAVAAFPAGRLPGSRGPAARRRSDQGADGRRPRRAARALVRRLGGGPVLVHRCRCRSARDARPASLGDPARLAADRRGASEDRGFFR